MKKPGSKAGDELRPEYDLRQHLPGATCGKYAKRYQSGTNLVLLDPDVHKAFATGKAVNDALRLVIDAESRDWRRPLYTQALTISAPGAGGETTFAPDALIATLRLALLCALAD